MNKSMIHWIIPAAIVMVYRQFPYAISLSLRVVDPHKVQEEGMLVHPMMDVCGVVGEVGRNNAYTPCRRPLQTTHNFIEYHMANNMYRQSCVCVLVVITNTNTPSSIRHKYLHNLSRWHIYGNMIWIIGWMNVGDYTSNGIDVECII